MLHLQRECECGEDVELHDGTIDLVYHSGRSHRKLRHARTRTGKEVVERQKGYGFCDADFGLLN